MVRFLIVIGETKNYYSAYCQDLPGGVATGRTQEQTARNMHAAIEMHLQGLREDNLPIPESKVLAEYIAIQT